MVLCLEPDYVREEIKRGRGFVDYLEDQTRLYLLKDTVYKVGKGKIEWFVKEIFGEGLLNSDGRFFEIKDTFVMGLPSLIKGNRFGAEFDSERKLHKLIEAINAELQVRMN